MNRVTYELIEDQLRAIYRVLTGSDAPPTAEEADAEPPPVSEDELERRFADVEASVRAVPAVAGRVPPYAFTPTIDVVEESEVLVVEAALPGVDEADLEVGLHDGMLVLTGIRRGEHVANGRKYVHAEIPRGPFRRVVALPCAVAGQPAVKVDQGLVRISIRKTNEGSRD